MRQRHQREQDSFPHKARPRKQRRWRVPEPACPISREEIVDGYESEKDESKTQRADPSSFLQVIKAVIANRQHQKARREIQNRDREPELQQPCLRYRLIQWPDIEEQ